MGKKSQMKSPRRFTQAAAEKKVVDLNQIRLTKLSSRCVEPRPPLKGPKVVAFPRDESNRDDFNRDEFLRNVVMLKYLAEHGW